MHFVKHHVSRLIEEQHSGDDAANEEEQRHRVNADFIRENVTIRTTFGFGGASREIGRCLFIGRRFRQRFSVALKAEKSL